MSNTITGIIREIYPSVQVSEKFKKRDFVIIDSTNSQYHEHICFQLSQDKCSIIDNYKIGDTVTVSYNIRGREWTSPKGEVKYFNTIAAWKIEVVDKATPSEFEQYTNKPVDAVVTPTPPSDDLPW